MLDAAAHFYGTCTKQAYGHSPQLAYHEGLLQISTVHADPAFDARSNASAALALTARLWFVKTAMHNQARCYRLLGVIELKSQIPFEQSC